MSRRDDETSLRQMLDHAREIVGLTNGRTLQDAMGDRVLRLAFLHLFSILGEASRRVSSERRAAHPEVLWREITATRNWLIHVYDEVDFPRIWRTATEDVPRLVDQLERILR
jgi:uncharacterized protein with HEPN domain